MRTKIEKKLKGKKEISLNKLSYAKKITPRLLLLFIQSLRMRKARLVYLSRIFQESRTEKNETLTTERKIAQIYYNEAVSYLIPCSEPVRHYYVSKLI